jgi:eukaryotic-like serine/threonine-protein kinase
MNARDGTTLGARYRLDKVVGHGGMATVFEGRDLATGRRIAVKMLNPEYERDVEASDRFRREARIAAELEHPNIVDVLDLGDDDGVPYMVLEFLEGESLARALRRDGPLSLRRAMALLLPVMRGMAYVHACGVVHRDLKPENLFMHRDASGAAVPRVLDFGIARSIEGEQDPPITKSGMVMGTPEYMSPEQALGIREDIGAAADVWSMGVIWYEALTGARPFGGPSPVAILLAVSHDEHVPFAVRLPALPTTVAEVLERSIAHVAQARYLDMGAFLVALERRLADLDAATLDATSSPTPLPEATPTVPARGFDDDLRAILRRTRRHAQPLAALMLFAAVLVGAAVAFWAAGGRITTTEASGTPTYRVSPRGASR